MKKILFILALLSQLACKRDCETPILIENPCDINSLAITDSTCFDLQKYVIRNDTTAKYGHTTAIKSVLDNGEIEWISNNVIIHFPSSNEHYLLLQNYSDTSWIGLEPWAFRRENLIIKFDPNSQGHQKIYDETTYKLDSTKNWCLYIMWFDDFPGGAWDIDLMEDNYVNVISFDKKTNVVEGEFNLHFVLRGASTVPGVVLSDNIHFRCGHFKAKILE